MSQTGIFYRPWVGDHYGSERSLLGKRLLVVGALHYCRHYGTKKCQDCGKPAADPDCRAFTISTIDEYYNGESSGFWKRTFSAFINSVYGRPTSWPEREHFLNSVVFANYLQRAEGRNAKEKHPEYFADLSNLKAFKSIVRKHRPEVIVIWGARVRKAIPWDLGDGPAEELKGGIFKYSLDGQEFHLAEVHHPSMYYPSRDVHKLLKKLGVTPTQ